MKRLFTPIAHGAIALLLLLAGAACGSDPGIERREIVVVGGGIAGLSSAWFLRDRDVLVLEKEPRAGGRAVSGRYRDFRYARGAEYLGEPVSALERIIADLGITPVEIPYPGDARFRDGTIYFGDGGVALMHIERSSVEEYNRFGATLQEAVKGYRDVPYFEKTGEAARLDGMTARQYLVEKGFGGIYQEATNVACRGLFGASIDEISAHGFLPEIAFDFLEAEPVDDAGNLSAEPDPEDAEEGTGTYTFPGGLAELTDSLAERLGERIRLNATVVEVTSQGRWKRVAYRDSSGETRIVEALVVILAVPAPIALRLAPTLIEGERRTIMESIPYSSYATLALFTDRPVFDRAFDLGVPDGLFFTDIYDGTWVEKHCRPGLVEGKGCVLSLYIAPRSHLDRSLDTMPEAEILERAIADAETIFPGIGRRVVGHDLQRFPHAYPVMTPGAYARLDRLARVNSGTVLLAGDYTLYPTFEHAAISGYYAALKAERAVRFPLAWLFD